MTVKKTLKKKAPAKKASVKKTASKVTAKKGNVAENILGSANEIWLAGLGAFAKAQQEGVKIFNKLVDEGKGVENLIKKTTQTATKEVVSKVDTVKTKATKSWDKLENIFESRVEKVIQKLDIPSTKEIGTLLDKIESLSSEVAKLTGNYVKDVAAVAKKTVKKAPTKKAAVNKVAKKVAKKATTVKKTVTKAVKKVTKKAPVKKVAKKVTKKIADTKITATKVVKKVADETKK